MSKSICKQINNEFCFSAASTGGDLFTIVSNNYLVIIELAVHVVVFLVLDDFSLRFLDKFGRYASRV